MPRKGSTRERGYGPRHRKARAAYVAAHRPGDPCCLCGKPMTDDVTLLDLAHNDRRDGYRGLSHRSCNRGQDAARKRRTRDPDPKPVTRWG